MVMMMNKLLVKLYVPSLEEEYNVWIPLNKRIGGIVLLLVKAINEISGGIYKPSKTPVLYDKITAMPYDMNLHIQDTNIRNGSEIILI